MNINKQSAHHGRFKSLETRLILMLLFLSILPAITIGWVAHNIVFENIRTERIKTVGRVADAKHDQLVMVLTRANDRAKLFLSDLNAKCNATRLNKPCSIRLLESYLALEGARGATLHSKSGASLTVGSFAAANVQDIAFKTGQLAKFTETGAKNKLSYIISAAEPATGLQLEISYPSSNLQRIFDHPPELGLSGETFLTDGEGYFITQARYPSTQGHGEAIHANPMLACLNGKNTEMLDLDYRDAKIIHGFRLVPEFGAACIMAHIDQSEAFAPLAAMENKVFSALLFFILLAFLAALYMTRRIATPVKQLTSVARAIAQGDYTSQASEKGVAEISELGASFNAMTSQLTAANDQLKQKVGELQQSEERYRKLFEEATDAIAFADAQTGALLDLNQSFADMLGWERSELIGKPQKILHPDVDEAAVSDSFERHRSKAPGEIIETQAITKDGSIIEVSIKAAEIELNGRRVLLGSFRDITGRKLAEQKLIAAYRKLQQFSLQLDKVKEEEQGRIAREIHDEMGATLTALKMRVHWLASRLPPEMTQLTAEAEQIDKLVGDAIHTMRQVVGQLMPTQLHALGFAAAIEQYVHDFQKHTGIECGLVLPEDGLSLDENQSSALFRIIQESLNNVAKHAQASKVTILCTARADSLILLVKDNGVGFDRNMHKNHAFGLLGITERAMVVNGKVRITSRPGKGTRVLVRIPLAKK